MISSELRYGLTINSFTHPRLYRTTHRIADRSTYDVSSASCEPAERELRSYARLGLHTTASRPARRQIYQYQPTQKVPLAITDPFHCVLPNRPLAHYNAT